MKVNGIDRSDLAAVHERVHIAGGTVTYAGGIQGVLVCAKQVQSHFHVSGRTHIHAGAATETFEGRILEITFFIQIANGEESIATLVGCAGAQIVFLTVAFADSLVEPVDVVRITSLDVGVRDQFAICGEEGGVGLVEDV